MFLFVSKSYLTKWHTTPPLRPHFFQWNSKITYYLWHRLTDVGVHFHIHIIMSPWQKKHYCRPVLYPFNRYTKTGRIAHYALNRIHGTFNQGASWSFFILCHSNQVKIKSLFSGAGFLYQNQFWFSRTLAIRTCISTYTTLVSFLYKLL